MCASRDARTQAPSMRAVSAKVSPPLIRKPEMHDVAVGDDIVLAFEAELAGVARAGLAAQRDIVGVGDGLGARTHWSNWPLNRSLVESHHSEAKAAIVDR